MKKWIVTFMCLAAVLSCTPAPDVDLEAVKEELLEADKAFARMAYEEGRDAAFLAYMADDVTIMPRKGALIRGRDNYQKLLSRSTAEERIVRWTPFFADASQSGDFGYTLGTFQYFAGREEGAEVVQEGSYVTIWKKQADGRWTFVFDAGNDKE
jgi:ketosteroid isomerase-like protein